VICLQVLSRELLNSVCREVWMLLFGMVAILENGQALELFLEQSPRLADRACASPNRPSSLHVSTNRMRKPKETSKA
jgi:hypothetical protein